MHIVNFADATGTYAGTLNQYTVNSGGVGVIVPGTATPITVTLTEATIPNRLGAFSLDGTVIATGACPAQFTIAPGTTISGGALSNTSPQSSPGLPSSNNLFGAITSDASSLFIGSFLNSGPCTPLQLQGNLAPQ